jgi:cell division septum initiation protein DivIVA
VSQEEKPLMEIGERIGRMLQDSHDAAEDLRKAAESEATSILEMAHRTITGAKAEASRLIERAEAEAAAIVEEARSLAARMQEQITRDKRLADAEGAVARREAHRQAKLITDMARREATEIVEASTGQSATRARELEHRIRVLQIAEVELRARIRQLEVEHPSLEMEAVEQAPR